MKKNDLLLDKSFLFASRMVKLHSYLTTEKQEEMISKRIFKSATLIRANADKTIFGLNTSDYIKNLQKSLKETAETQYWVKLLELYGYIGKEEGQALLSDCTELKRLLTSTLDSAKKNNTY